MMSALTSERVWSLDGVNIELAGKRADMLREKQNNKFNDNGLATSEIICSQKLEFLAILKADY